MKKAILFLVVFSFVSVGMVFSQASITGKVDVDVSIQNALGDSNVTSSTASGDTEVDIKAAVDDFNSITIQFRGADIGTTTGITAGDIFVESNLVGAFGWSESVPNLSLAIKGGVFNPEPAEKGEVREVDNIADIIGHAAVVGGGALNLSIGYTDWLKVQGGVRFATGEETDVTIRERIGWYAGISGEGGVSSDSTAGKLGYSAHVTNNNAPVNDENPVEIGVGVQYSGLQVGTIRSAGGAIAEPADVPIFQFGVGGQFVYFLSPDNLDTQWQWGANLGFNFISIIDLGFEVGGDSENVLDGIGVGLSLVNPGENVGRIFNLGVEFTAKGLGGEGDPALNVGPEISVKAGNTGPQFRFGIPINIDAPEESSINLDVSFSF